MTLARHEAVGDTRAALTAGIPSQFTCPYVCLLGMLLVDGITLLIFGRNFEKGGKSVKAAASKPVARPHQR